VLVLRVRESALHPAGMKQILAAGARASARVLILQAESSSLRLSDLYGASDAYLSLHRSEGFGLNLAEAMLAGLPVVATAWSGNMQFMSQASAALVAPKGFLAMRDPQGIYALRGVRWADPDLDAAAVLLRGLAENRETRAALGERGRKAAQTLLAGGAAAQYLRA
jgi:glycosyltransferase involved in cell wall biosynthesis